MNVVFDFGGVLFAWEPARLIAATFPEIAPDEEAARHLGRAVFSHDDWQQFDAGNLEIAQVVDRTAQRLDLPHDRLFRLVQGIGEYLTPMPGTLAVLAELRAKRDRGADLKLYYLSNMPRPYARVLERRHEFLGWFDGGIFSGDVNLIKPDAGIYQLLARQYRLDPSETFFVDDLAPNIDAARMMGWRGTRFESAELLRQQLVNGQLLNR